MQGGLGQRCIAGALGHSLPLRAVAAVVHIGQSGTAVERIVVDLGQAGRQVDSRQTGGGTECVVIDFRDTLGHRVNAGSCHRIHNQLLAVLAEQNTVHIHIVGIFRGNGKLFNGRTHMETVITDAVDTLANGNRLQICAAAEGTCTNSHHIVGKHQFRQTGAAFEAGGTHNGQTGAKVNLLQRGTVFEGAKARGLHGIGKANALKGSTAFKGAAADGCGRAEIELLQIGEALEGIVPHGGHAVFKNHRGNLLSVLVPRRCRHIGVVSHSTGTGNNQGAVTVERPNRAVSAAAGGDNGLLKCSTDRDNRCRHNKGVILCHRNDSGFAVHHQVFQLVAVFGRDRKHNGLPCRGFGLIGGYCAVFGFLNNNGIEYGLGKDRTDDGIFRHGKGSCIAIRNNHRLSVKQDSFQLVTLVGSRGDGNFRTGNHIAHMVSSHSAVLGFLNRHTVVDNLFHKGCRNGHIFRSRKGIGAVCNVHGLAVHRKSFQLVTLVGSHGDSDGIAVFGVGLADLHFAVDHLFHRHSARNFLKGRAYNGVFRQHEGVAAVHVGHRMSVEENAVNRVADIRCHSNSNFRTGNHIAHMVSSHSAVLGFLNRHTVVDNLFHKGCRNGHIFRSRKGIGAVCNVHGLAVHRKSFQLVTLVGSHGDSHFRAVVHSTHRRCRHSTVHGLFHRNIHLGIVDSGICQILASRS